MLKLEKISSGYNSVMVVNNVSMNIKDSESILIAGRNGVGKTTLIRSIVGLNMLMNGKIYFHTSDISALPAYHRVNMGIGYVPQGRRLFPYLTVMENLLTAKNAFISKKHTSFLGFDDFLNYIISLFPNIIGLLNKRAGSLSGGEQQLVSIARALLTNPKVLLLDEPFEGIQPSIVQLILKILHEIKRKFSISLVIVEHRLNLVWDIIDKVYVMDNGRIIKEGQRRELTVKDILELISL